MSELTQHEQIVQAFNNYLAESETFEDKGVKAAAARARKALGELGKLSKSRRAEIQDRKNEM
jgi:N-glycosylase/DNA lyase